MRLHCERKGVESIKKSWSCTVVSIGVYCKVLESSNWSEIWPSLGRSNNHYTQTNVYGTTRTCGIKIWSSFLSSYMSYLEYEGVWRSLLFREHFSLMFFHISFKINSSTAKITLRKKPTRSNWECSFFGTF